MGIKTCFSKKKQYYMVESQLVLFPFLVSDHCRKRQAPTKVGLLCFFAYFLKVSLCCPSLPIRGERVEHRNEKTQNKQTSLSFKIEEEREINLLSKPLSIFVPSQTFFGSKSEENSRRKGQVVRKRKLELDLCPSKNSGNISTNNKS